MQRQQTSLSTFAHVRSFANQSSLAGRRPLDEPLRRPPGLVETSAEDGGRRLNKPE